jgi:hypothetical protein
MKISMSGVFAALITPIDDLSQPDLAALDRLIDLVIGRGVDGVLIGGAIGEYPHFDFGTRASRARQAVNRIAGRAARNYMRQDIFNLVRTQASEVFGRRRRHANARSSMFACNCETVQGLQT